jgi:hypothetical protein
MKARRSAMPGYTKDENSLATGIPDRTIGPETGSFGNATKTNRGDTSQGANQDHESSPAPAAGIGGSARTTDDRGERRSFDDRTNAEADFPESDVEPVYQQIADGGDHFDHHKRLREDDEEEDDELSDEDLADRPLP